jgi:uncharacterized OsmC-like protein
MTTLTVLHLDNYQHEATSRGHSIILDEPREQGGDDAGLSPYEVLLAALGGFGVSRVCGPLGRGPGSGP